MIKNRSCLTLILILLPCILAAEKWQKVSTKDGILVERIYKPGSPLLKFRGSGFINADVVTILSILQDIENQHQWNKNSYNNKIVRKISAKELITYGAIKVPWPFKNRDYLMHIKMFIDDTNRIIRITGKETLHISRPALQDMVRIQHMRTEWIFKPLAKYKGKKTFVQFSALSDPGGNIPNWLINSISKHIPYKTIANIRKLIKKKNYDQSFTRQYKQFENWF